MPDAPPATVLVLRALGLGDLCTAVPALRALSAHFPQHRVLLAAPAWQRPLAVAAGVHDIVAVQGAIGSPADLEPLPDHLRGVDVAVNLHGRGPESSRRLETLRPRRLIAFEHEAVERTMCGPRWLPDEHEVRRWCRLLTEVGIDADPSDLQLPSPEITPPEPGVVVVHPGAASAARRWPGERFAAVVSGLVRAGHRVAVTGSGGEVPLCEHVAEVGSTSGSGEVVVLAGRTSVTELAATVASAVAVITNDTGVAHLATAFSTPSVVLFGPTPPHRWGPPPSPLHRAIWTGRTGDPHAAHVDPGLLEIGVDEVLGSVREVIGAGV
jgi:ADP-heptose:LPS heptosyltransferase